MVRHRLFEGFGLGLMVSASIDDVFAHVAPEYYLHCAQSLTTRHPAVTAACVTITAACAIQSVYAWLQERGIVGGDQ